MGGWGVSIRTLAMDDKVSNGSKVVGVLLLMAFYFVEGWMVEFGWDSGVCTIFSSMPVLSYKQALAFLLLARMVRSLVVPG